MRPSKSHGQAGLAHGLPGPNESALRGQPLPHDQLHRPSPSRACQRPPGSTPPASSTAFSRPSASLVDDGGHEDRGAAVTSSKPPALGTGGVALGCRLVRHTPPADVLGAVRWVAPPITGSLIAGIRQSQLYAVHAARGSIFAPKARFFFTSRCSQGRDLYILM